MTSWKVSYQTKVVYTTECSESLYQNGQDFLDKQHI